MEKWNVGVFGATGEVGQEILNVLYDLEFPVEELNLYGRKSAGKTVETPFGEKIIKRDPDYSDLDLALWAVSGEWSKKEWPKARDSGCYVIDLSSAFRLYSDVPLIVPEINGHLLEKNPSKLIANPNCTTAIAAMPLYILNEMAGIRRIIFSTYQSASGAGSAGRKELLEGTEDYLGGKPVEHNTFPQQLPFNLIPRIDEVQEDGYTKEEMKTDLELRKILGLDDSVRISSGCVRVPVERSHAEDITVETRKPVDLKEFRNTLDKERMLEVRDDPKNDVYPTPLSSSGKDQIEVGRIRYPEVFDNGVRMFVSGDQLLRGAALNAVLTGRKLYSSDLW